MKIPFNRFAPVVILIFLGYCPSVYGQDEAPMVQIAADTLSGDQQEGGISVAALEAYNAGVTYAAQNQTDSAVSALSRAIALEPEFSKALYNRASLYMSGRNYVEALSDYESYLTLADTATVAWFFKAQALAALDRKQQALEAYDEAIRRNAFTDKAHLFRGEIHYQLGDHQAAIDDYTAYLRRHPSDATILHDRGGLYAILKDDVAAESDYRQATLIAPDMVQAWANLGSVLRRRDRLDEAIAAFDEAIKLEPHDALILNNRGQTHFLKDDFKRAAEDFRQAIKADPNYAFAHNNLAGALIKQEEYADAIRAADKAIELDRNYGYAYLNRGIAREMVRDIPGACSDWHQAAELNIKNADAYHAAVCKYIK